MGPVTDRRFQVHDEETGSLIGYIGVDADARDLPLTRELAEEPATWRQIKGDTRRIRTSLERNQTADITESGFGGYMLRLNEIRRTIRVERIR